MDEQIIQVPAPTPPSTNSGKLNPWMVSTLVMLGVIAGFGISQLPYFKGASQQTQVAALQPPSGQGAAGQTAQPSDTPQPLTADQIAKLPADSPTVGSPDAKITVVEFSDFQCPYCEKFFTNTLSSIQEDYVKTGKVKIVYRNFPLEFHPQAFPAAEAGACANEQGKFWEMHDKLFRGQQDWAGSPKAAQTFSSYAKSIGLDSKQFDSCMTTHKFADGIRKDSIDGVALGVNGTPSFFINGKPLSGAMPYETIFKPIFEAELAGKQWSIKVDATRRPYVEAL